MQIETFQQHPAARAARPKPSLHVGDLLLGRVLRQEATHQYVVSLRGTSYRVQSGLPLEPGNFVLLQLLKIHPLPQFKLVESFTQVNETLLSQTMDSFIQTGDSQLIKTYIQLSLGFQLPVNITYGKELDRRYRMFDRGVNPTEAHFLFPFFFQNINLSSALLSDPFFFFRWYWGDFNLRETLEQVHRELQKDDRPQSEFFIITLQKLQEYLETVFHLPTILSLLFELPTNDRQHPPGKGEHLMKMMENLLAASSTLKKPAATKGLNRFIGMMKFLFFQVRQYQQNKWGCFPLYLYHSEGFFFAKREGTDTDPATVRFQFTVDNVMNGELHVSGIIKGNHIRVDFIHPNQDFLHLVENKKNILGERVSELGLPNLVVKTLLSDHETNFFETIIPRKSFNLNRFL